MSLNLNSPILWTLNCCPFLRMFLNRTMNRQAMNRQKMNRRTRYLRMNCRTIQNDRLNSTVSCFPH